MQSVFRLLFCVQRKCVAQAILSTTSTSVQTAAMNKHG